MTQIKILHCLIGSMNVGGIETVLMEVYRNIDRNKFVFDFVVHDKQENYFEKEINMLGGTLYRVDYFSKHPLSHLRQFNNILIKHPEYEIIHIHTTYAIMFPDALLGKIYGRKIIVHSHNADAAFKRKIVHLLLKKVFESLADYRVACSDLAAQWMFTSKHMKDVFYWYNAFDVSKFCFDKEIRNEIRQKYGVTDKFVIGNVGRLSYQKNQTLLIKIFFELQKQYDDIVLWLVGDGEDRKKLEYQTEKMNIEEKVRFIGNQSEVQNYLFAMDVYVCTSRYEGLGISLVEAQATGIPIITGYHKIPKMAQISEEYDVVNRETDIQEWCNQIMKYQHLHIVRDRNYQIVLDSNFNISNWIKQVEQFYKRVVGK